MMRKQDSNNKLLFKYAGLATQFLVSIGLTLFMGYKIDDWIKIKAPLFIWLLPLLVIVTMIWQIINDTSKK